MSHDAEMVQLSNSQRKKLAAMEHNLGPKLPVVRCPHCKQTFDPDPAKTSRIRGAWVVTCSLCGKTANFVRFVK